MINLTISMIIPQSMLNASQLEGRLSDWFKKQDPAISCLRETHFE